MGGGGLVGSIGGLVGMDSAETKAANSAAGKANATAAITAARMKELGEEQMAFNQGLLDDWEGMFGPMEENLTDYYSNLDPAKFAQMGKTGLNEQIDKQLKQVNDTLSAQGLQTSGMYAQSMKEGAFAKAQGNAAIDLNAPEQVAQMQQGYVNSKEHRRTNANQGINQSYASQMGATQAGGQMQQQSYQNQAQQYAASGAGWTNLLGSIAGAGAAYASGK